MLLLVGLAHELDVIMGVDYTRTMAILFLIGNEGLSVLENMGLMGIKYPAFLIKALESLKDENGGDNDE
jgi:toxin secretion/phage lysis holin